MVKFGVVRLVLVIGLLYPLSLGAAPNFNSTGFQVCTTALANCSVELLNFNPNATNFSNCTTPFAVCFSNLFTSPPPWEACYSAEAAEDNFYISIGAFLGVLIVNNLILPACFKGAAWAITQCMNFDVNEHPVLRRIGRFIGVFTDGDRNNQVTATELINPQAIITFSALALPFYYLFVWNDKQALCDYARALWRYNNPQFGDDDDD